MKKQDTSAEFDIIEQQCADLFANKNRDYGSAWRVLRLPSLTDQIYIKARRVRSIQETGITRVNEGIIPEFIGIVNYSVMALVQLEKGVEEGEPVALSADEILNMFHHHMKTTKELMLKKNHDYGEAWRQMRITSLTDIILMKLLRIKSIEDNKGKTLVSEGLAANYQDIINYAMFALIRLTLENEQMS
ncbi:MAG: DUF1599 domain-containing protein [Bacteroidales bacterium]|jgi:hypothetical protein|nr:DUF1599 domain-containing protein [Bacteroidales bacterium]